MARQQRRSYPVIRPDAQVSFYYRLRAVSDLYLHDALKRTVESVDLRLLDRELVRYVGPAYLKTIASLGLRGEVVFPVPCIIESNPFLLGYYRLFLGFSQKEFYNKGPFGRLKALEDRGELPVLLKPDVRALCKSLIRSVEMLVDGVGELSLPLVHDLQLLTIGPQLRGSANTTRGRDANREVHDLILGIVRAYVKEASDRLVRIENESGRAVLIEFLSDPDVRITEALESHVRPLVSVEVKGGTDASNIHNRLGEAEKSHQKAKNRGFLEFWTLARVDVPREVVRRDSPTTSHFFYLDRIGDRSTTEYRRFRDLVASVVGIRA